MPVKPIRAWQIWNEPNFKFFVAKPNPAEYGKLVKLSSSALKSVDPGAQVVLAGLFSQPKGARYVRIVRGKKKLVNPTNVNYFASYFLEQMYKSTPGIKSKFAGVALHPYTGTWKYLTPEIEEVRKVLTANGDGRKGLWITELGWSSGPPASDGTNLFAKGPAGQARELKKSFQLLKLQAGQMADPAPLLVLGRRPGPRLQLLQRLRPLRYRLYAEEVLVRIRQVRRRHAIG